MTVLINCRMERLKAVWYFFIYIIRQIIILLIRPKFKKFKNSIFWHIYDNLNIWEQVNIFQIAAELEQYRKAIQVFEEIAIWEADHPTLKYGAKTHFFQALLCYLCVDVVSIPLIGYLINLFGTSFYL